MPKVLFPILENPFQVDKLTFADSTARATACEWRHLSGHTLLPPVCIMRIDGQVDATSFARYGIMCPPHIARSVPQRQAEFFYGRRAAAEALAATGIAARDVAIGAHREPVWPAGIIGSISHNRQHAAAVAAVRGHYSGLGIDLETVCDPDSERALREIVVGPSELAYLRTLVGVMHLGTLLTIVFSAKESLFKGAFSSVGCHFDFSAAKVAGLDVERGLVRLLLQQHLSGDFRQDDACTVQFEFIDRHTVLSSFAW